MIKIGKSHFQQSGLLLGFITLYIFLILLPTEIESRDIEVTAVVSPRHIQFNEKATLELTISGKTQINHIRAPQFNFFPDFITVPLETQTIPRLIDDTVAVTMEWIYELIPQKIGEFVLPDISFSYQGIPYMANPGRIIVGASDTYRNSSTGGVHRVIVKVDNHQPYLNQRIQYKFQYLYTTVLPTPKPPTPILPNFNGFVVEKSLNEKNTTTIVEGKKYYVQVTEILLYPKKSGQILINPAELILHLSNKPKTLKSKPIPITVQSLPEIGKPTKFSGAVGDYKITAQVDRQKLKVRNGLTLSLQINGNGNHNNLIPPNISINNFRVDPPKHVQGYIESKTLFSYVVIPLKSGILQIPAIEFSFFNPSIRSYQITKTDPIPITVVPTTPIDVGSESNIVNWFMWLMLLLMVIVSVFIGFLLYRSKWFSSRTSPSSDNLPEQNETELVSIDTLEDVHIETSSATFGSGLLRILHQNLCRKIDEPFRHLTNAEVQEICNHISVSNATINEINDIITKCEHLRYSPQSLTVLDRETLITRTKTVIQNLESTQH